MADEYNPNDFEWRFQRTLKEHREKLDVLTSEVRAEIESELREKFREYEKEDQALLKENFDIDKSRQRMLALAAAHDAYTKSFIDETPDMWGPPEKEKTPEKAWERFQEKQKEPGRDQERER
jgi:hypothetical protein